MIDENYSSFHKLGQTRVIISPMSPKIAEKRERRGKGSEIKSKKD